MTGTSARCSGAAVTGPTQQASDARAQRVDGVPELVVGRVQEARRGRGAGERDASTCRVATAPTSRRSGVMSSGGTQR